MCTTLQGVHHFDASVMMNIYKNLPAARQPMYKMVTSSLYCAQELAYRIGVVVSHALPSCGAPHQDLQHLFLLRLKIQTHRINFGHHIEDGSQRVQAHKLFDMVQAHSSYFPPCLVHYCLPISLAAKFTRHFWFSPVHVDQTHLAALGALGEVNCQTANAAQLVRHLLGPCLACICLVLSRMMFGQSVQVLRTLHL